jgi:hypothetical protein
MNVKMYSSFCKSWRPRLWVAMRFCRSSLADCRDCQSSLDAVCAPRLQGAASVKVDDWKCMRRWITGWRSQLDAYVLWTRFRSRIQPYKFYCTKNCQERLITATGQMHGIWGEGDVDQMDHHGAHRITRTCPL